MPKNRLRLLDVDEMPRVPGLETPQAFYTVLRRPAKLAGMSAPTSTTPWTALAKRGFAHVICLTADQPTYDPGPLHLLHAVTLEDLIGGRRPRDPSRELERIAAAVSACLGALRRREGVVVHCAGGTGRTGTLIGGVLCRLGIPVDRATRYLDAVDRRRGAGWPESAWQADALARLREA